MKMTSLSKVMILAAFTMNCGISIANTTISNPINIGALTTLNSFKNTDVNYYKFNLPDNTTVSIFLNGLSAGYQIQLLDANGNVLQSSSNNGTSWISPTNSGTTGGTIVSKLKKKDFYYVRVSPTILTGNPLYKSQDGSYTVNIIPDSAPNTVTVGTNTLRGISNTFTASGTQDENIINQAIAFVANNGGGTVLLRPGTYSISNNVMITYNNITLMGSGWSTVLKLQNGIKLEDAGLLRSASHDSNVNFLIPYFSNQHFLHMALDGNKGGGTNIDNSYGNFGTYWDSSFEDMRVHDFPHYGFDPHQNQDANISSYRVTIKDSLADHNDIDGMTTDSCIDSIFKNNILDFNGRHGINIVTGTSNSSYLNNIASNNGANGITIQPGTDLSIVSNNNILNGNIIQNNLGSGIYAYLTQGTQIINNTIAKNGKYGIQVRFSSSNVINGNTISENSQSTLDTYDGIAVQSDNSLNLFSNNNMINNNIIQKNSGSGLYIYLTQGTQITNNNITLNGKYGIHLRSDTYNIASGNTVTDNSQGLFGGYAGIYLANDAVVYSTYNQIFQNFVSASTPTTYKFGIAESSTGDDYNTVTLNTIQGVSVPIRMKGLNSTATSNTILP